MRSVRCVRSSATSKGWPLATRGSSALGIRRLLGVSKATTWAARAKATSAADLSPMCQS